MLHTNDKFRMSKKKCFLKVLFLCIGCLCLIGGKGWAQNLKAEYNPKLGIKMLSYKGHTLLNTDKHIGAPLTPEGFLEKERNGKMKGGWSLVYGASWDNASRTISLKHDWGTTSCRYELIKDTLFLSVLLKNEGKNGKLLKGVSVSLLTLNFPESPANFQPDMVYAGNHITAPAIVKADLKDFSVTIESTDVGRKAYVGMIRVGKTNAYRLWLGTSPFNGMKGFDERAYIDLKPGESIRTKIALKFTRPGVPLEKLANATLNSYRKVNPLKFSWTDRRPIGALFLSSYGRSKVADHNARNWTFTQDGKDQSKAAFKSEFRTRLMAYADRSISILKEMGAQGAIVWDLEGQEFEHPLSYIGDPEQLAWLAPEMNDFADEFFKKYRNAGLKIGVCIRPDSIIARPAKNSIARISVKNPAATLIRKIQYCKRRWGTTLFYIDSNFDSAGNAMSSAILEEVLLKCPDVLLIPELQNFDYYRYSAPYEHLRGGTNGMNEIVKYLYPSSFMVLNVAEGLPKNVPEHKLVEKIKAIYRDGNIVLFRAWYNDSPTNQILKKAIVEK